jgi:hypothetical protein
LLLAIRILWKDRRLLWKGMPVGLWIVQWIYQLCTGFERAWFQFFFPSPYFIYERVLSSRFWLAIFYPWFVDQRFFRSSFQLVSPA